MGLLHHCDEVIFLIGQDVTTSSGEYKRNGLLKMQGGRVGGEERENRVFWL